MENVSMKDMLAEANFQTPRKNDVVTGKVVMITDDNVIVNIGYKADGVLPKSEVSNKEVALSELFSVDQEIEVMILKKDNGEGNVLLSTKKLNARKDWDELEALFNENKPVTVKITEVVKGGLSAFYKEIRAFIPASHIDVGFVKDLNKFVGQEIEANFLDFNKKKNQVVLSRRELVQAERSKNEEAFWGGIELGKVVTGVVRRFTNYGAFIELGQADGLLHVSEISWGKVSSPSDVLKKDEEREFKVIEFDRDSKKISLSIKQLTPNPWDVIDANYKVDERYNGKVVSLTDFGAFVELEPGLEGLVHVSQISDERIEKPSDVLSVGQEVEVAVIEIDKEEKRLKLGIK